MTFRTASSDIEKREEAARQLFAHVSEMEKTYSQSSKVVIVIAGDFNTGEVCLGMGKRTIVRTCY